MSEFKVEHKTVGRISFEVGMRFMDKLRIIKYLLFFPEKECDVILTVKHECVGGRK